MVSVNNSPAQVTKVTLLELFLADREIAQKNYFGGLDALRRSELGMKNIPSENAIAMYIDVFRQYLYGMLYEGGIEYERSADAYVLSAKIAKSFFADKKLFATFSDAWMVQGRTPLSGGRRSC
jgi:hypothetical protein